MTYNVVGKVAVRLALIYTAFHTCNVFVVSAQFPYIVVCRCHAGFTINEFQEEVGALSPKTAAQ